MDLQRTLLIGAAAVLSFMLLTEWVSFKEEKEKAVAVAQNTTRITSSDSSQAINDFDQGTATTSSTVDTEDDIPLVTDYQDQKSPEVEIPGSSNNDRIIQIHTDVLQLAIDLDGGDIIESALPAFLEKLDNPDVPLVLLEQNERRIYIAQSGLIEQGKKKFKQN